MRRTQYAEAAALQAGLQLASRQAGRARQRDVRAAGARQSPHADHQRPGFADYRLGDVLAERRNHIRFGLSKNLMMRVTPSFVDGTLTVGCARVIEKIGTSMTNQYARRRWRYSTYCIATGVGFFLPGELAS